MNSRQIQNLIHIVGAVNSLVLFLSGFYAGKNEWIKFLVFVICYLVLTRVQSELMYRRQKAVIREELNNQEKLKN